MKKLLYKAKDLLNKEKKNISIAIISGLIFTSVFSMINYTKTYALDVQKNIANEVVRFHVLANSNSMEDQNLKVLVKDRILENYKEELVGNKNRDEALLFMKNNLSEIEAFAEEVMASKGYNYEASAKVKEVIFPTKVYGEVKLPAGKYTALQIEIGEGIGDNWWCVMYPPLCYVDVATTVLEETLTEEEFLLITDDSKKVELEFKIVEYWNSVAK